MNEIWKDIPGYEGLYQVSNMGRVLSLHYRKSNKARLLSPRKERHNYLNVFLCKNGHKEIKKIHQLVALAFLPNPNKYTEINHKDENPQNNRADNLEWCSRNYNMNYGNRASKFIEASGHKILQMDMSCNVIKEWPSVRTAAKHIGVANQNLFATLKGRQKTCGGYKWKYVELNG